MINLEHFNNRIQLWTYQTANRLMDESTFVQRLLPASYRAWLAIQPLLPRRWDLIALASGVGMGLGVGLWVI